MKRLFLMCACVVLLAACEKEPLNIEVQTDLQSEESLEAVINNRVSQGVAVERAIAAINGLKERAATRAAALKVANMRVVGSQMAATRSGDAIDTLFYLINFEDEQGFALVAADERNTDVFMMAEEGSLDLDNLESESPINFFLDCATAFATYELANAPRGFGDIILDLDTTMIEPGTPRDYPLIEYDGVLYHCKSESQTYTFSSYTTTQWHQGSPYNQRCYTEDGQRAVAGCVAIAMAQIMAYHQHPATYNWEAMLISPTVSSFYFAGVDAVSTLVADIGEAVDMDYGVNASGSNIGNALLGFLLSFDYAVGGIQNYDVETVLNNIRLQQPVYIRGESQISDSGHAWVVDGVTYDIHKRTYYDRETLLPVIYTTSPPQHYQVRNNVGWSGYAPIWTASGMFEYYGANYSSNVKIIDSVRPR